MSPTSRMERQTHHGEIVAVHTLYDRGPIALDAVRAGLVHRLACIDVAFDVVCTQRPKGDANLYEVGDRPSLPANGDSSHHGMRPATQAREHLNRVRAGARLSEHVAIDDHDGVAADHHAVVRFDGARLLARQSLGVLARCLTGNVRLVDVCRLHVVDDSRQHQQLASPRRRRGQNHPGRTSAVIVPTKV